MTVAERYLFGAIMLALLTLAPVKQLAGRAFDNADPRNPEFYQFPVRRRALGAHLNGLETFPFFVASILLAEFRHAPQDWIDGLAIATVIGLAFALGTGALLAKMGTGPAKGQG